METGGKVSRVFERDQVMARQAEERRKSQDDRCVGCGHLATLTRPLAVTSPSANARPSGQATRDAVASDSASGAQRPGPEFLGGVLGWFRFQDFGEPRGATVDLARLFETVAKRISSRGPASL
jgi:hypothetical protein